MCVVVCVLIGYRFVAKKCFSETHMCSPPTSLFACVRVCVCVCVCLCECVCVCVWVCGCVCFNRVTPCGQGVLFKDARAVLATNIFVCLHARVCVLIRYRFLAEKCCQRCTSCARHQHLCLPACLFLLGIAFWLRSSGRRCTSCARHQHLFLPACPRVCFDQVSLSG